jgi:hypothetical protein
MGYKSLFSFAIVVSLWCCKTRDNEGPEPENRELCLLSEYSFVQDSYTHTEKYFYNSRSLLDSMIRGTGHINIQYDDKGRVQRHNLGMFADSELSYDEQNRLKTAITKRNGISYYSFFEYSADGHLRSSVYLHGGEFHLEKLYNPDFDLFMKAIMAAYTAIPDSRKVAFKRETDYLYYKSFDVDKANLLVTYKENSGTFSSYDTPDKRHENIVATIRFDGKKSPNGTSNWRPFNLQPFLWDFSELGNVIEYLNPMPDGWVSYKVNYQYNQHSYPIKAEQITKNDTVKLSWEYVCR